MTNGGDIVTLLRLLGHTSLTMTMKYAHFSPVHLAEVIMLNPLAVVQSDRKVRRGRSGSPEWNANADYFGDLSRAIDKAASVEVALSEAF